MKKAGILLILGVSAIASLIVSFSGEAYGREQNNKECEPTQADMLGPFYKQDAPVRDKVGEGYALTGKVQSAGDCSLIPEAEIEFWQAGPDGYYDDAYRATVVSGEDGHYRFETDFPGAYGSRPPHIHIRVSAEGHETLVTQHYPEPGTTKGEFDLVLIPESE